MGIFDFFKKKSNNTTDTNASTVNNVITYNKIRVDISNYDDICRNFIAFDLETTGLSAATDQICEIGIVKFVDGVVADKYNSLVKINGTMPPAASRVNGITDALLTKEGKNPGIVYPNVVKFIEESLNGNIPLVAHNADFDMSFLVKALNDYGYSGNITYIDTLQMCRKMLNLEHNKLGIVANHFNIVNDAEHRATSDAVVCGKILVCLLDLMKDDMLKEKKKLQNTVPKAEELEICAIIINILKDAGQDISQVSLYKNASGYVDMLRIYKFLRLKLSTKGNFIIMPKKYAVEREGLHIESCTKTEDSDNNVRVFFDDPFDLQQLSERIVQLYIENDINNSGVNDFEDFHLRNSTFSVIATEDIPILINNLKERRYQKELALTAETKERGRLAEEKARKQAEKEELSKKKEENTKKEELARKLEEELKQADSYTLEEIKNIVETSTATGKRPVIKLDDNGNILKVYTTATSASDDVGIAPKTIRDVCNGKYKHGGGYCWMFADDYIANNNA